MLPRHSLLKTPDPNGFTDQFLTDCQGKDTAYVIYTFIYLFIFGCVGSLLLHAGFL